MVCQILINSKGDTIMRYYEQLKLSKKYLSRRSLSIMTNINIINAMRISYACPSVILKVRKSIPEHVCGCSIITKAIYVTGGLRLKCRDLLCISKMRG